MNRREARFSKLAKMHKSPKSLTAWTDFMTRNPVAVWARFWMRWLGR